MSEVPRPRRGEDERTDATLRSLLAASQVLVTERSLTERLHEVVATAREVAGARSAALGVLGPDGRLEQFEHVGLDDATASAIREAPAGGGLLADLLRDPHPVRLPSGARSPQAWGEPAGDLPTGSFLGVPVRSATATYGGLCLTKAVGEGEFTAADEAVVLALAASAGVAVENARLHEQAVRRQEWLRAAADVGQQLLQSDGFDDALDLIAGSVLRLASADTVTVVTPTADDLDLLEVAAAAGSGADQLRRRRYPRAESLVGQVLGGERGLLVDEVQEQDLPVWVSDAVPLRQLMLLALRGEGPALGGLVVGRAQQPPFTQTDLDMADVFAEQASLALERTAARSDRDRLAMLEDRYRIARDLHDHVVQRLFAAGLTLQAVSTRVRNQAIRDQLAAMVTELNATIRRIRDFIAELQDFQVRNRSARLAVMATVMEMATLLGVTPGVTFRGPLDSVVDDDEAAEVGAVLRERLLLLVRSGKVRVVEVEVAVDRGRLVLTVDDDGPPPDAAPSPRVAGARPDARQSLAPSPLGGSRLTWSVPLSA